MIFLDASFIVSYVNSKDQNHKRALELAREIDSGNHGPQVISDYILDEVLNVILERTKDFELAVSTGKILRRYTFIQTDMMLFERTWEIFLTQKSPYLSFTDCNTLAVCEREGITKLATFDRKLSEKSGLTLLK
ncbi:PilT protein domain protein [mine drainage metagenome]|uniref:PilT protein domain protein n=1 Tax=mine drainage metagenome TaxID=410659 RepID=T1BAP5_9ZZZZ